MTFVARPTDGNNYDFPPLVWRVPSFDKNAVGRLRLRPGSYRLRAALELTDKSPTDTLVGAYPNICEAEDSNAVLKVRNETEQQIELTLYKEQGQNDPCRR